MHFYGIDYQAAMTLPLKAFWMLNGNVDRIQAQQDIRRLTLGVCGFAGGDAAKELRQQLIAETGTLVRMPLSIAAERDEVGVAELKKMAGLM